MSAYRPTTDESELSRASRSQLRASVETSRRVLTSSALRLVYDSSALHQLSGQLTGLARDLNETHSSTVRNYKPRPSAHYFATMRHLARDRPGRMELETLGARDKPSSASSSVRRAIVAAAAERAYRGRSAFFFDVLGSLKYRWAPTLVRSHAAGYGLRDILHVKIPGRSCRLRSRKTARR